MPNHLNSGEVLHLNESLTSKNGFYSFVYQSSLNFLSGNAEGHLVLYRNPPGETSPAVKPWDLLSSVNNLWSSGTEYKPIGVCVMQTDGNLVICGPGGEKIWETSTAGHPGSRLVMQDDGNVAILQPDGVLVWETRGKSALPRWLAIGSLKFLGKAGCGATLVALTEPRAICSIKVFYKSGPSSAAGLGPKSADGAGYVFWVWWVGRRVTPGTWRIEVTTGSLGAGTLLNVLP